MGLGKSIVIHAHTFSRPSHWLHVFPSSFGWFVGLSMSFVIGSENYTGFGFDT